MSEHQFRKVIRNSFFTGGGHKRWVHYKHSSFLKDINITNYVRDEDGAYRMYNGKIYFTYSPTMEAQYSIEEIG